MVLHPVISPLYCSLLPNCLEREYSVIHQHFDQGGLYLVVGTPEDISLNRSNPTLYIGVGVGLTGNESPA